MSSEFTGERVIPGHVDADLWNEHLARYAFARPLCSGRKVLDAGCGTGYGSRLLADNAANVIALDFSSNALSYGRSHYDSENLTWAQASCTAIPFAAASFDVVVSFEVIEHLADYEALIAEAHRVLTPDGIFIVSTPNKNYYAEARSQSGPNPFHEHEFELDEFKDVLHRRFDHVAILFENHTAGISIEAAETGLPPTCYVEASGDSQDANYFVAVCSARPAQALSTYIYIPRAANVLKERALHIQALEAQLSESRMEHAKLVALHTDLTQELRRSNEWAKEIDAKLAAAQKRIVELQGEYSAHQHAAQSQIAELDAELDKRTQWARQTEDRLTGELNERTEDLQRQIAELAKCVDLLQTAEATVVERTNWALELQRQLEQAEGRLAMARASRWVKLGRVMKLGPELNR